MWRSHVEVADLLRQSGNTARLERAAALSVLARSGLRAADYTGNWAKWVVPTTAGSEYLAYSPPGTLPDDASQVLLFHFFHHDLLVDPDQSDLDSIEQHLSAAARSSTIRWPYRLGRGLYDRFNDLFTEQNRTDHLLPDQTISLLSGTPQGIFQLGTIVTGELGLLPSLEKRFMPPWS